MMNYDDDDDDDDYDDEMYIWQFSISIFQYVFNDFFTFSKHSKYMTVSSLPDIRLITVNTNIFYTDNRVWEY